MEVQGWEEEEGLSSPPHRLLLARAQESKPAREVILRHNAWASAAFCHISAASFYTMFENHQKVSFQLSHYDQTLQNYVVLKGDFFGDFQTLCSWAF